MNDEFPEIECPECCGNGQTTGKNSGEDIICPDCKGEGWRPMTMDEYENHCEDRYTAQFEGEPPVSARERYEAAWAEKQRLRR